MAKWSEKMMAETPEGWKEQPMGLCGRANLWAGHEGCEYCGAKEGYRHQPSCVVGLRQHLSGNGMRPTQTGIDWGKVGRPAQLKSEDFCGGANQWSGHTSCEHCNCKDGHYSFCPRKDGPADEEWVKVTVQPAYYDLFVVLQQALWQAQNGKGHERHADSDDQAFTDQPALTVTRAVGLGFPLGQAMKKIQECQRMDTDAAKRELLGAINYLAAAVLFLDE